MKLQKLHKDYAGTLKEGFDFLKSETSRIFWGSYKTKIVAFFALLGAYHFTKRLISVASFSSRLLFQRRLDLLQRYGQNSYVMITGAAQGIGKTWAKRFIEMGFNLVIIDIDDSKLRATEKELLELSPKAKIVTLVIDLSQIESHISRILTATENLDISILVNNAGLFRYGPFDSIDKNDMLQIARVNTIAPLLLTREFIGRLRNRSKRSAIINMSSLSGIYPPRYFAVYAGTKSFLRYFSFCIEQENRDKIDVLNVAPGFVATQMTKLTVSWKAITTEECVDGALRDLGRTSETMGSWKHAVFAKILGQKPSPLGDVLLNPIYMDLDALHHKSPKSE